MAATTWAFLYNVLDLKHAPEWALSEFFYRIDYLRRVGDLFTLASMACVLGGLFRRSSGNKRNRTSRSESSIAVDTGRDCELEEVAFAGGNSEFRRFLSHNPNQNAETDQAEEVKEKPENDERVDTAFALFQVMTDEKILKRKFADVLRRMGLLCHSTLVSKCIPIDSSEEELFKVKVKSSDNSNRLHCVVCRIHVRGLHTICQQCGHGGHVRHVQRWFQQATKCPSSDCDCHCMQPL